MSANRPLLKAILKRWRQNEHELRLLADLPVGPLDPAERERLLLAEQDALAEAMLEAERDGEGT